MNRRPLNPITDADVRQFQEDGVICLRGMFDQEWITRMSAAVDRIMDDANPLARPREVTRVLGGKTGRYHINSYVFRWMHSPNAEIAARLMGADEVRVFYDQVFVKEPRTQEMTDWHHDLPFWPLRGEQILSVWVALTDVGPENSALEYIAGSHKWGKFYRAAIPDKDPNFKSDLEECPNFSQFKDDPRYRFLSWTMKAGDCLVHHPLTVHGAPGNFSPTRRRAAISTRYFGPDTLWDPRPATMKVTGDPQLPWGRHPSDDRFCPVAWRKADTVED